MAAQLGGYQGLEARDAGFHFCEEFGVGGEQLEGMLVVEGFVAGNEEEMDAVAVVSLESDIGLGAGIYIELCVGPSG